MTDKSKVFTYSSIFTEWFKHNLEAQLRDCVLIMEENVNQNLSKFLKGNGVVHHLREVAKRKIHHLREVTRTILFQTSVLRSYWGCSLTATYLISRLSSQVVEGVTLIQLMTTFYPYIPILTSLHNRVFGCSAFVHVHSPYRGK